MFNPIVQRLVNKSGYGNVNTIVNILNKWWKEEKESDRLNEIKSTIRFLLSSASRDIIYWNDWNEAFHKCNYLETMKNICCHINLNQKNADKLYNIIIYNVLLDDLLNIIQDNIITPNI